MRILLQHIRTQLYLESPGNWTANPLAARDFQHSQKSIDFAREFNIADVQIAVKFTDSQFDEVVPLPLFQTASQKSAGYSDRFSSTNPPG
jgi:hypothetical protein